ncbi:MAG: hypothetical protein LBF63_08065 [Treponema sp.]|nr:hypothetical protein [Treponema sp.]
MGDIAVQSREPPKGATFESVWALLQENARLQAERQAELDKKIDRMVEENVQRKKEVDKEIREARQQQKETDRQLKETDQQLKKTDRQLKKTDQQLGKLGLRMGEAVEYLMSPKLHRKFDALGFCFNHSSRNHELRDHNRQRLAEIDVFLENGEYAMAVEVKTHLTTQDVKDHVKRMEILRRVADEHGDKRSYMGAVAGLVVTQEVQNYALKNGFFVIIPSADTVDIVNPEGFKARIW